MSIRVKQKIPFKTNIASLLLVSFYQMIDYNPLKNIGDGV